MPQFFVELKDIHQDVIDIRGRDARHLQDVLRLEVGDWVVICDGAGHRFKAEIMESRPLRVQLRRGECLPSIRLPRHVTLAAAVIRPQRFDWLVEKAFELGCRRLIPLTTERSVAHYIKDARRQQRRWKEIALSAAKQSGLPWLPEVSPLTPLSDVIQRPDGRLIYCWEGLAVSSEAASYGSDAGGREARRSHAETGYPPVAGPAQDVVTIVIGPEGGFSPAEHERLMARNPYQLSLGPLILRSETAAIAALIKVMQ